MKKKMRKKIVSYTPSQAQSECVDAGSVECQYVNCVKILGQLHSTMRKIKPTNGLYFHLTRTRNRSFSRRVFFFFFVIYWFTLTMQRVHHVAGINVLSQLISFWLVWSQIHKQCAVRTHTRTPKRSHLGQCTFALVASTRSLTQSNARRIRRRQHHYICSTMCCNV